MSLFRPGLEGGFDRLLSGVHVRDVRLWSVSENKLFNDFYLRTR